MKKTNAVEIIQAAPSNDVVFRQRSWCGLGANCFTLFANGNLRLEAGYLIRRKSTFYLKASRIETKSFLGMETVNLRLNNGQSYKMALMRSVSDSIQKIIDDTALYPTREQPQPTATLCKSGVRAFAFFACLLVVLLGVVLVKNLINSSATATVHAEETGVESPQNDEILQRAIVFTSEAQQKQGEPEAEEEGPFFLDGVGEFVKGILQGIASLWTAITHDMDCTGLQWSSIILTAIVFMIHFLPERMARWMAGITLTAGLVLSCFFAYMMIGQPLLEVADSLWPLMVAAWMSVYALIVLKVYEFEFNFRVRSASLITLVMTLFAGYIFLGRSSIENLPELFPRNLVNIFDDPYLSLGVTAHALMIVLTVVVSVMRAPQCAKTALSSFIVLDVISVISGGPELEVVIGGIIFAIIIGCMWDA